ESTPDNADSDKLMGDADGNGKVNVKDVTEIQKHAANILQIPEDKFVLADVNEDGRVNVKDATAIQKWIAGMTPDSIIGTLLAQ
ncbi:MAG: dockerin type I repeat-containing protein, partial [Eubacteriales bacterium]|nr:dockerin type I repeat-containing protein [Eubacteriales bacterium]